MRNFAKRAAEGPPDDGTNTVYASLVTRRSRRRKQAVIGAVGLVSIFGASVLVTQQVLDARDTASSSPNGALERMVPAPAALPSGSDGPSATAKTGTTSLSRSSSGPGPRTSSERIAAARSAAAKATSQVRRPLPPRYGAATEVSDDDVTRSTMKRDGETLRVVSARHDLTGYRELGWVADKGQKVGDATCTQKIRLSPDDTVRMQPTLLLCWRTSATRSVFTVAVKIGGRPSRRASVAEIDNIWSKLS
jgi:hypothetical protein